MIAITSIPPTHRNGDHIANCIQSWINAGYEVHSINHKSEIEQLKSIYPKVKFFHTQRTHKVLLGKHYVLISALIDHAKDQDSEHFLLINADIEIYDKENTITEKLKAESANSVIVMHRQDYTNDINYNKRYLLGIDAFFLNKKHLDVYPQTRLCMGQCFWDYWMPFVSIRAGVPTKILNDSYIYHIEHPTQYSADQWQQFGHIMMHEVGLTNFGNNIGKFNNAVYSEIISNAKPL